MGNIIFIIIIISIVLYFGVLTFNYYYDKRNRFTRLNLFLFKDEIKIEDENERKQYMNILAKHYLKLTFMIIIFAIESIMIKMIVSDELFKNHVKESVYGSGIIELIILTVNIIIIVVAIGEVLNLSKIKQKINKH